MVDADTKMDFQHDFSTNLHSVTNNNEGLTVKPTRHPDISFNDGNLAILTGPYYFLVHQGVLCRASEVIKDLATELNSGRTETLEGYPVLYLPDPPLDMARFLQAIYDGLPSFEYDVNDFTAVAGLLVLSSKYRVERLRSRLLDGITDAWPTTLEDWDVREVKALDTSLMESKELVFPHPIMVIKLAREIGAPQLLPSAFYDLSRYLPSEAVAGYWCEDLTTHELVIDDVLSTLRGREHASRFLSTFVVNNLEGRNVSAGCLNRSVEHAQRKQACRRAFEAVTFSILRNTNGLVRPPKADPLNAIAESYTMLRTEELLVTQNMSCNRACEVCAREFGASVDAARETFWGMLPEWFNVDVEDWGT